MQQLNVLLADRGEDRNLAEPAPIRYRFTRMASAVRSASSAVTPVMPQTADVAKQHALLDKVAGLVDAGKIRTAVGEHFGIINAANLKRAHALLESVKACGSC